MSNAVAIMISALLGGEALTALVGTKIHPDMVPRDVSRPCIRVYLVSEGSHNSMGSDHGPYMARVTVEVFAETATSVHAVMEAVKTRLEGFVAQTVLTKKATIYRQGTDMSTFDDGPNQVTTFRRAADFMVGWS